MQDIKILKEVFQEQIFGQITETENMSRYSALLKETGNEAKLKKVIITGLTEDSLLLKIDSFGQLNTIFKDTKGQLQKCDYVLITKHRDKRRIIFIELKSSQPGSNSIEIHNQFKSTECLMDYCDSILEKFHNEKNLLNNSDKVFIVFFLNKTNKTKSYFCRGNSSKVFKTIPVSKSDIQISVDRIIKEPYSASSPS